MRRHDLYSELRSDNVLEMLCVQVNHILNPFSITQHKMLKYVSEDPIFSSSSNILIDETFKLEILNRIVKKAVDSETLYKQFFNRNLQTQTIPVENNKILDSNSEDSMENIIQSLYRPKNDRPYFTM